MYVCEICRRKYRSRAWLDRHLELKHGTRATAPSEVASAMAAEGALDACGPREAEAAGAGSGTDDTVLLARACGELLIDVKDILSSRVYSDRVAIVEGPVGYKRVWRFE